jgi:hypothetical protein
MQAYFLIFLFEDISKDIFKTQFESIFVFTLLSKKFKTLQNSNSQNDFNLETIGSHLLCILPYLTCKFWNIFLVYIFFCACKLWLQAKVKVLTT